jgi:hypothetical protein
LRKTTREKTFLPFNETQRTDPNCIITGTSLNSKQSSFREKNKFLQTMISDFMKTSESIGKKIKATNNNAKSKKTKNMLETYLKRKEDEEKSNDVLRDMKVHRAVFPRLQEKKANTLITSTMEKDPMKKKINKVETVMQMDNSGVYKFRKMINEKFGTRASLLSKLSDSKKYETGKTVRNRNHSVIKSILDKTDRVKIKINSKLDKIISNL